MTDETRGIEFEENENLSSQNTENAENTISAENQDITSDFEETAKENDENIYEYLAENNDSDSNDVSEEITDAQAENTEEAAEENIEPSPVFADGAYYTKIVDGGVADGYEWCADEKENTTENKKAKKSSDRGFKIFIGTTLSVFTISVVILAVLAVTSAFGNKQTLSSSNASSGGIKANSNFDYSGVVVDNPNFVAFEFKDREGQVLSIPEIAAKCSPSSVGIISEIETTYNYPFYFAPSTRIAEASGSGFIYSADGYIITNHHVIENAKKIRVILYDGKEFEAELIGSDALSDIAVLKITPDEATSLIPMEIGNSDELVVGEGVVAIGCPAGVEFIGTVTDGIVSAINRNVELTDDYGDVQKTMTLIQTNATINHGNSGGPLINSRGQVIGINTLKLSADYEGIGFSIPINGAVSIITQLIEHGTVIERTEDDFAYGKGMIGINGSAISEDEAEYYGIPQGILVVQIDRTSSAANAGLRRGDIITHYNGKAVKTVDDINNYKGSARAGTEVTLTVYRDGEANKGETIDITFKLDAQQ